MQYKIVTKVIANRLKEFLHKVIGQEQSSFVPHRQIADNIVIYQEALHTMRSKKGIVGHMVLKIDLEKAYDRLSWKFLQETLQEVGLNQQWVRNIMACVTTSRLAIIWNGDQLEWIKPGRGVRQGDPLSPYLFVLCMERLSHSIKAEVARGNWRGMKLSRYGPTISHLFFADDMVLFAEANEEQLETIKRCLKQFEEASGQRVSLKKSQIFFSRNVEPDKACRLSEAAGISQTSDLGRYLGVPSVHGRVTPSMFSHLIERTEAKLEGWRTRYLSLAGKMILAQSVLSAIPFYSMQTSYLPLGLCDDIEKRIRKFLWGNKIHLVSWETVTKDKKEGDLGIRNLRHMNLAFLAKLGWRMINEKDTLWVRIIQAKYRKNITNDSNFIWKTGASNVWKGICEANFILKQGVRKVARTGRNISFWHDRWIHTEPLITKATKIIIGDEVKCLVADYWTTKGTWDWEGLSDLLPRSILNDLNLCCLNVQDFDKDEIYWDKEISGLFSVASAYSACSCGL